MVNVAVDRPVSQSFTYLDWAGDKAVDGNTCRDEGQYPDDDKCCSATKVGSGDEVFWMIDLEEQYEVTRLEIFARNGK